MQMHMCAWVCVRVRGSVARVSVQRAPEALFEDDTCQLELGAREQLLATDLCHTR